MLVMVMAACCSMQHEKFQSAPGSRVGTPAYLAPEVILTTRGKTYDGKVSSTEVLACYKTPAVCAAAELIKERVLDPSFGSTELLH